MYTILMDVNKSLITPKKVVIYQGENLMDNLNFIIPKTYNDIDISDFSISMEYILPGNIVYTENLTKSDDEYSDTHNCYTLPIDSKLTTCAGDVTLSLLIFKIDSMLNKKYQLHTGSLIITVKPKEIHYVTVSTEGECGDNEFDVVEFSNGDNTLSDFDVIEF